MVTFIFISVGVFLAAILLLVILLLVAKSYLSPNGNVNIEVNGTTCLSVPQGGNLMATLNDNGIYLLGELVDISGELLCHVEERNKDAYPERHSRNAEIRQPG